MIIMTFKIILLVIILVGLALTGLCFSFNIIFPKKTNIPENCKFKEELNNQSSECDCVLKDKINCKNN